MKHKEKGFTIVELLTAIAIIAILIGILVPSLISVRNMAKQASQKAQLMAIDTGLMAYRNDFGDYPPSYSGDPSGKDYCGAQKLAEAMVGLDLMGLHPDTAWRADGQMVDSTGTLINLYYPTGTTAQIEANLKLRKGHYIELEKANVFRLFNNPSLGEGLFSGPGSTNMYATKDTYVICDVFGVRKMTTGGKKTGTPILYYKANTNSKVLDITSPNISIYNVYDNASLVGLGILRSDGTSETTPGHPLASNIFYNFESVGGIRDSRMATAWPHNPDSYILISAGLDGEYGTADDIRNFGK